MGRLPPREHQSIYLLPRVLPEEVGELHPTMEFMTPTRPMKHPSGHAGAKRFVEVTRRADLDFERRPDLADNRGEMGVRGTERRKAGLSRDLPRAAVVAREVFGVVDLDGVKQIGMTAQIDDIEAHRGELGVGYEDDRVLAFEFGERPFEGEKVRDRLVEIQREDVFPVTEVPGEDLASGDDEEFVVAEALGTGADIGQTGEMRGVDENIETAAFRPIGDALVENLHVGIDSGWHAYIDRSRVGDLRLVVSASVRRCRRRNGSADQIPRVGLKDFILVPPVHYP